MVKLPIFWILVVAFALRLATVGYVEHKLQTVWHRDFVISGDAEGYWELGTRIATGQPYELYSPPRQAMRMPGYPLFLSVFIRLFGESHLTARIAGAVVGTIAVGLVFLLGRELLGNVTGNLASFLTAISPQAIGTSSLLLSETLFSATVLLSLWSFARLLMHQSPDGQRSARAVIVGLAVAFATYVRPTWLPACIVFAVIIAFRDRTRKGLLVAALIPISTWIALTPWGIRNQTVTGQFVLTTLWSGPSLYDGFNPDADGGSNMEFFDRENVMSSQNLTESEMNRHYLARARHFIAQNPARSATLMLSHARRYWSPWPNAEQFRSNRWIMLSIGAFSLLLFLAALAGFLVERRNGALLVLCGGPILAFGLVHTFFVGSIRYRLPGEYPLTLLAAVGLLAIVRSLSWSPRGETTV